MLLLHVTGTDVVEPAASTFTPSEGASPLVLLTSCGPGPVEPVSVNKSKKQRTLLTNKRCRDDHKHCTHSRCMNVIGSAEQAGLPFEALSNSQ